MGLSLWYFLRPRPGNVRPVSHASVDAFFFGEGRLPVDDDGLVRYFDLAIRLENREAIEVVSVGAHQCRALADGSLDREGMFEFHAVVAEAVFGGVRSNNPVPGIIDAGHRFAQRRLDHLGTWKPTDAELAILRELVNNKAHRIIM